MSIIMGVDEINKPCTNTAVSKREEYLAYINEHIANVKKACDVFLSITWDEDLFTFDDMEELKLAVEKHDESKYSDAEFEPYRKQFFPVDEEEKNENEEDFETAWEHHYRNNDHHPQFWVRDGIIKEMSNVAIAHMICDWEAMSYKFGGSAYEYYCKDGKNKTYHHNTVEKLEKMLNVFKDIK